MIGWLLLLGVLLATQRRIKPGVVYRWTHEWRSLTDAELQFLLKTGYDPSVRARVATRDGDRAIINYDQALRTKGPPGPTDVEVLNVPGIWNSGKWFVQDPNTRSLYRLVDVRLPEA